MTTTFVTAFCLIENYKVPEKTLEGYFNHFKKLADTKINIAIYISPSLQHQLLTLIKDYPNVKLMDTVDLEDTWVYKTSYDQKMNLPVNRNPLKDSFEYMVMQNAKIEFCYRTIQTNPFHTDYFAWIDFGIFHVIKDVQKTTYQLQHLSQQNYIKNVIFPGCWPKGYDYVHQINWRFCGGFFLGHQESLLDMWQRFQIFLPLFLSKYETMLWEVNIWTAMEWETNWSPIHYQADHNDTIITIPNEYKI